VRRWQEANDDVNGAEARLGEARCHRDEAIAVIGRALSQFGYPAPTEALNAREQIASLTERYERWRESVSIRVSADRELRRGREDLEAAGQARANVHQRLGIDPSQEPDVERWSGALGKFRAAEEAVTRARSAAQIAREALDQLDPAASGAVTATAAELEDEIQEHVGLTERIEELQNAITKTETLVADARRRHDVEAALAAVTAAEEAVIALRERDIDALVGNTLVDHLRERIRDESRPEVFHAARRWFGRVTRGRCELEFTDSEPPTFRAIDTVTGLGHGLDQLSGGTRVQLLLAVRTAFVETHEMGLRLPLLLDEALATADDDRAAAIIESVIEMARAGRQVFYFTAQMDEVSKWRTVLESDSLPYALIDLRESATAALAPRPDWLDAPAPLAAPPEVGFHDYDSYGRALGLGALDPSTSSISGVHLWYILQDLELLSICLNMGIDRWGPFRQYVSHSGPNTIRQLATRSRVIESYARGVESFISGYSIGRGRPVDRVVLEESGAISSTFMERIVDLAREQQGDAAALLESIENKDVKRFPSEKLEQLREYLVDKGHLDERPQLTADELRARVIDAMSPELNDGLLEPRDVHRLLRRLGGPTKVAARRPPSQRKRESRDSAELSLWGTGSADPVGGNGGG
jgi:hypothetical protein